LTKISSNILNRPAGQMRAENRGRCVAGLNIACSHMHERKLGPAQAVSS
jgi:hypothetical protein